MMRAFWTALSLVLAGLPTDDLALAASWGQRRGPDYAETILIDDFAAGSLARWHSSTSPEYYPGRRGLSIETDGEVRTTPLSPPRGDSRVLRAVFGFGDQNADEPIWITRKIDPPLSRLPIKKVRFRYRWEVVEPAGATTAPVCVGGFKVRLRTSATAHTNFDVPTVGGGYPVGRWITTEVDVNALHENVRNIYRTVLADDAEAKKVYQLTLRLDDVDNVNAHGALWVSDIVFVTQTGAADTPHTPEVMRRHPDERFDLLNICHNGDGFYDFDQAARQLDPEAGVVTSSFRGLHFPIWDFPATREELLKFDVIVLADVDPWVFTTEQIHWLADAVHSGVGLLVGTGPQSFSNARRHPSALLDLLPVTYEPAAKHVNADAAPVSAAGYALVAGFDPATLGRVGKVNAITPRGNAEVLMRAGKLPLLVAWQAGHGRVLVLNSWAQPVRLDDGSFMTTHAWQPFAARMLAWLAGRELPSVPRAPEPLPAAWRGQRGRPDCAARLEARWLYSKSAFAPASPFGFVIRVRQPEGAARGRVSAELSAAGQTIWRASADADKGTRIEGVLPEVASGPVQATITMPGAAPVKLLGQVVDPLRGEDFYPIITYLPTTGGGHVFDLERVDALVREVHDHGFNTIAVGGLGATAGGRLGAVLRGRAEATAGSLGMASILEYTRFTEYSRKGRYKVSPFAEGFEAHLRKRVARGIEQARYVPRLLSVKYVDEPFMRFSNLDDSQDTRGALGARTGRPYVGRESLDNPAARYAYGRFLSAYLEQDFTIGQKIKTAAGAPWDLLQTYCSPGYGSGRALDGFEDVYRWTRPADRFDFDVYPYFYPTSGRIRFVQANWCFAASRVVSRKLGKPWGFYVELDDRNYPYQINPVEASAECAYTAVAAGADYLNTFMLTTFGSGTTSRPERWQECGEAMRAIRRIGPLLTRWKRQPARVAILFPETHQLIHNGYTVPMYALSILAQAVGDADVIHEEIFAQGPSSALDILVLAGADALRRDAKDRLVHWVQEGGAVAFDRLPTMDEQGKPLDWPKVLAGARYEASFGKGRAVDLGEGFEARCRQAVEGEDPGAWPDLVARISRRLSPLLRRGGEVRSTTLSPPRGDTVNIRVTDNRLHTDVGVRRSSDSGAVLVVNHHAEPRRVTVELGNWNFMPEWAVDLVTNEAVVGGGGRTMTLSGTIPGRDAWLVGVYEKRPAELAVNVATGLVRRGGMLRYKVICTADGALARGTFLLELTVIAPNGIRHQRLGGVRATVAGVCEVQATVPVNAATGTYTVKATAPHAGLAGRATFVVR